MFQNEDGVGQKKEEQAGSKKMWTGRSEKKIKCVCGGVLENLPFHPPDQKWNSPNISCIFTIYTPMFAVEKGYSITHICWNKD